MKRNKFVKVLGSEKSKCVIQNSQFEINVEDIQRDFQPLSLGVCGIALSQARPAWGMGSQSPPGGESRHLAAKGANANLGYSSQEVLSISQAESVSAVRYLSRALAQEDREATLTALAYGLGQAALTCPLTWDFLGVVKHFFRKE